MRTIKTKKATGLTYAVLISLLAIFFMPCANAREAFPDGSTYDVLFGYQAGMAVFEKGDKQGAVNRDKQVVIPPIYDFVGLFEYGLTRVQVNGKWGLVRDTGEVVIATNYDYISTFGSFTVYGDGERLVEPIARIEKDGKCGFMDWQGRVIAEPRFDVEPFYEIEYREWRMEAIGVRENGLWGLLGLDGHMLVEPRYTDFEDIPPIKSFREADLLARKKPSKEEQTEPSGGAWWDDRNPYSYTYVTDTSATNDVTVEDITAVSPMPFPEENLTDYIANLQNVYHNTKWFYAGHGPYAPREITDLDNFTFWPFFREGVVSFDFQVFSNTSQENPAVIYMNPYGEVLRVLFVNAPEDEKGYCDAWDFWDLEW